MSASVAVVRAHATTSVPAGSGADAGGADCRSTGVRGSDGPKPGPVASETTRIRATMPPMAASSDGVRTLTRYRRVSPDRGGGQGESQ